VNRISDIKGRAFKLSALALATGAVLLAVSAIPTSIVNIQEQPGRWSLLPAPPFGTVAGMPVQSASLSGDGRAGCWFAG
jgi:hypothetical protein